ncbi:hypothetical protein PG985_005514 [Apiospora marii]|uniref:uncharacterized protein n=1 Tax=Apiospora marii TaxID=335849 RepID=UPI003130EA65
MLINTLKMPTYRAAADSIPITNQGHEAALFRHFPGFAFSERCIIANNSLPKNIHPSGLQNVAGPARRDGRYAANDWDASIQSTQRIDNPLPAEIGDGWDAWMAELPDPNDQYVTDPIVYWFIRRFKYPRLSQMALDTLTIPAMSAECERLFSAAGRLLNSPRSSLDIVIVSMCMALRSWLRAGILHDEEVDQAVISVAERVEHDALEQLVYGDQVTRVTQWIAEGEPRPGSRNRGNDEVDDSPE